LAVIASQAEMPRLFAEYGTDFHLRMRFLCDGRSFNPFKWVGRDAVGSQALGLSCFRIAGGMITRSLIFK